MPRKIAATPVNGRPRRHSNLGEDIRGDTSAAAVATMPTTAEQREASRFRRRTLSKERRRPRNWFTIYREASYRHTWLNPLIAIIVGFVGYLVNPKETNPLHSAIFLSYPIGPDPSYHQDPTAQQYGKGTKDINFVIFYTFFFSFTREFLMQRYLRPLAHRCGITKKGKVARFMEQTYTAIYFSFFVPWGLWILYKTEIWRFNTLSTRAFYENYPHRTHTAEFKAYYLLQAAYWLQQAIVLMLQLEKPRSDFKELVLHHIVTVSLIALSYRFHFTWIGLAVFFTHDCSDFFLATSKTLNYLDHPLIGPYFGFFIFVWIYMRHYINLRIIWSLFTEFRTVGPWLLDWEAGFYKCFLAQTITTGLLGSIQALNLFWLYFIIRIAKRFVMQKEAVDERSEDEAEEESDEPVKTDVKTPEITVNGEKKI
ncbi:acyl-CoA-dependent ceramide synthase [Ascodesmis nigricans]|uniref:Acyl-CoA-dependent ceramide synthase n=1 Tax=Ascodesmis nigricans TaxID=341454 RepID=A0A4S2MSA4_9PEZI|nr:acyl-CoA-dependent ceramide synthase [Ascodesmis nigricans]